jgi:calcium-dependent protein kinase
MHCKGIVHRDIKPENLLVDSADNTLKLMDFGLSIRLLKGQKLRDRQGTPYYMAPEVLSKSYDHKCDIWSCGVVLYIMLCGRPPFNADHYLEIMRLIKIGEFHFTGKEWQKVSPLARDLV